METIIRQIIAKMAEEILETIKKTGISKIGETASDLFTMFGFNNEFIKTLP